MKKSLLYLLLIFMISPLLTGCTRIENKITINNDKSAILESTLYYDGNLSDENDKNALLISENFSNFIDKDYVITREINKNTSLIKAHKKFKNITHSDIDLSSLGFKSNLPNGRFIDVKKNFFVTLYNIDISYDYKAAKKRIHNNVKKSQNIALKPEYYHQYFELEELDSEILKEPNDDFVSNIDDTVFQLNSTNPKEPEKNKSNNISSTFSIELPAIASYNNADKVEGTTYTWNILQNNITKIKIQYIVYSGYSLAFILLIGLAFLIYIAKRVLKHDSLKRIGTNN